MCTDTSCRLWSFGLGCWGRWCVHVCVFLGVYFFFERRIASNTSNNDFVLFGLTRCLETCALWASALLCIVSSTLGIGRWFIVSLTKCVCVCVCACVCVCVCVCV